MAGRRQLLFVTIIALLVVVANVISAGNIAAGVRDVISPLHGAGAGIAGSVDASGFFTSRSALEAQIASLQQQLQQDQLQSAAFQVVQQENASLSQLEHVARTAPGIAARVTSSVISSPYGTFMVGAGSAQGVAEGSLVLEGNEFVVGKIAQVQANQSLADAVFAPGAQTPVSIDGAAVVASGQGGDAVAELPHGVAVTQGDPVVAPAFGGRPIGTVQYVDSNPANAQQAAYISLPVAFASLQFVYITPQ